MRRAGTWMLRFALFGSIWTLVGIVPAEAGAVPLPPSGASALTSARVDTQEAGFEASGPVAATPNDAVIRDPNPQSGHIEALARAEAQAFPPGGDPVLRSYSEAADNTRAPIHVISFASIVTSWVANTDGSVVPLGAPVDLDALLSFEGSVFAGGGPSVGAFAAAILTLHTSAGSQEIYRSSINVARDQSNVTSVVTTGDWQANRVGAVYHVDYDENLSGLLSVIAGEPFALELRLTTLADILELAGTVGDRNATADFFDTGALDLEVSVEGITLTRLDVIPEPGTFSLLLAGLLGLGATAARRR